MTYMEYTNKYNKLSHQQAFCGWVKHSWGDVIDDTELSQSRSEEDFWNYVNLNYSKYLTNLC